MPHSVLIDRDQCTGCGICARTCPVDVFDIVDKKSVGARAPKCMGCQLCEVECPEGAIQIRKTASKPASPWDTSAAPPKPAAAQAPAARAAPPVREAAAEAPVRPPEGAEDRPAQKPEPAGGPPAFPTPRVEEGRTREVPARPVPEPGSVPAGRRAPPEEPRRRPPAEDRPAPTPPADTLTWEYPSFKKTPPDAPAAPPSAQALQRSEGPGTSDRKVLTVFPELCVNCRICELVCSLKHTGEFNPFKTCVKISYTGTTGPYTPTICRHCRKAACEAACPTSALYYDDDQVVLLDRAKCIRCLECVRACPFAAIQVGPSGEIYKCDLCGGDPACAKYCPPRPENTAGRIAHPKASAIQYVEPHNVSSMKRIGLASSKK